MMKLKPQHKKFIRPVLATVILVLGAFFMLVPFIPLGYIFIFAGLLILTPYLPFVQKWLDRFKQKDKGDYINKAENAVNKTEKKIDELLIDRRKNEPDRYR